MNDEGLGVAPNQQSTRTCTGGVTMSHNKNCNPMTKDNRTHAQVTKSDFKKREEVNSSQQQHDIDSLNGNARP